MKLNTTVALTFLLLAMMAGAGTVSGLWGYTLGYKSLKGVSQPPVNPSQKLTNNQNSSSTSDSADGLQLVREDTILINVYNYKHSHGKNPEVEKPEVAQAEAQEKSFLKAPEQDADLLSHESSDSGLNLPVKTEDQGVTLSVEKVSQERDSLLLAVNIKNEGSQDVRFLYSFLDVRDDQGRALSAITDGLPGELPANGQPFMGTVKIPSALLDDAQKLSLSLTDYPDQKLQLKLSDIPVGK
ncbi:MAG: hypothetical protein ACOC3E_01515 [Cyanobacteriota bacterium]